MGRGSAECGPPFSNLKIPKSQDGRWGGVAMSGFNGWIVCRFHGARGSAPEVSGMAITGIRFKNLLRPIKAVSCLKNARFNRLASVS